MHPIKTLLWLVMIAILSACNLNPYSISVNNNVLFRPGADAPDETFSDPALQACVNNYLIENPEESIETLSILSCTDAGISSINGLDSLSNLSMLDLSNNTISDLRPVGQLDNLRVLRVSNNRIRSIGELNELARLNFIDLSGNNDITCRALDRLQERLGNSLLRPLSCI